MSQTGETEVVVIGGGLGGLAAAAYLARAGRRITLLEKSRTVGGRAITTLKDGYAFNLGPHALYRDGEGQEVLRELGLRFGGGVPTASGGFAVDRGVKHTLPGGFVSLLTTSLFGLPAKLETAKLLGGIQKIDVEPIQRMTVRAWLDRNLRQPGVRRLIQALTRLTTYANDPERQSAGAAIAQLQMALRGNVVYLHGGWQTLVDGLRAAAEAAGVRIRSGVRAAGIEHDGGVRGVRLADGSFLAASVVIVAAGPAEAAALLPGSQTVLHRWAEAALPVRAACLDVALSRLPWPKATFALGIDQPLYLSVHSAFARLAPEHGATIHVAKYLEGGDSNHPKADERELEGLLDLVQPGWRDLLVERRFLPGMTVSHALPTATAGGKQGRPGPEVPDVQNLYVVGDWVGSQGLLADASLASAKRAAELIRRNCLQAAA
jgi:phytoene dehydrogenase-like protein